MGDDCEEELFMGFQENMALIAGYSFEILKLYEVIKSDFDKITKRVRRAENKVNTI